MKTIRTIKVVCLIALMHSGALTTMAQKIPVLVFDFSKGTFQENDYFENGKLKAQPFGSFATLRIINVNTFRWKVEVTGRNINYVTPVPSELQTIFRLTDVEGDNQKTEQGLAEAGGAARLMDEADKNIAKFAEDEATLADADDEEEKALKELEDAMDALVKSCKEYVELAEEIAEVKFTRIELINVSKQKWDSHSSMSERLPAPLSKTEMKEAYLEFAEYFATSSTFYSIAKGAAERYEAVADTGKEKQKAKAYIKQINDATKKFGEGHDLLYEDNFLKLIDDVMVLQEAMENEEYFVVTSPPIQMDGDYVFFDIKTTPARTSDLMPYDFGKTFPVEVPIKEGLKVDFSVGPVFSFGKRSRDEKFYIEPGAVANTATIRKRDNGNAVSPGIAAMMHAYRRNGKTANLGILFGVGAGFQSVTDANFSFYGGFSAILGKSEKLMINFGLSTLSVSRLKKGQYEEDKSIYPDDLEVPTITEKVLKGSVFFGISYNLTNRVIKN